MNKTEHSSGGYQKRLTAFFLAAALCLTVVPTTVFATGAPAEETQELGSSEVVVVEVPKVEEKPEEVKPAEPVRRPGGYAVGDINSTSLLPQGGPTTTAPGQNLEYIFTYRGAVTVAGNSRTDLPESVTITNISSLNYTTYLSYTIIEGHSGNKPPLVPWVENLVVNSTFPITTAGLADGLYRLQMVVSDDPIGQAGTFLDTQFIYFEIKNINATLTINTPLNPTSVVGTSDKDLPADSVHAYEITGPGGSSIYTGSIPPTQAFLEGLPEGNYTVDFKATTETQLGSEIYDTQTGTFKIITPLTHIGGNTHNGDNAVLALDPLTTPGDLDVDGKHDETDTDADRTIEWKMDQVSVADGVTNPGMLAPIVTGTAATATMPTEPGKYTITVIETLGAAAGSKTHTTVGEFSLGKVIVKHTLKELNGTTSPAQADITNLGKTGDAFVGTGELVTIPTGYRLEAVPTIPAGGYNDGTVTIEYVYVKTPPVKGKVVVEHYTKNAAGVYVLESTTPATEGLSTDTYTTAAKSIANFALSTTKPAEADKGKPVTGGAYINGDTITVKYYYDPIPTAEKSTVTTIVVVKNPDGSLTPIPSVPNTTQPGVPGGGYTTTPTIPPGYQLVETPGNSTGIFPPDGTNTDVTYMIQLLPGYLVVEHILVVNGVETLYTTVAKTEGANGAAYTTAPITISGFKIMTAKPAVSPNGSYVTNQTITAKYYYEPVTAIPAGQGIVTVEHVLRHKEGGTTTFIEYIDPANPGQKVIVDVFGTPYTTTQLTILGYKFVEASGDPITGSVKSTPQNIIYYYEAVPTEAVLTEVHVIKHPDGTEETILVTPHVGPNGGGYTTNKIPNLPGYSLVKMPINATGTYVTGQPGIVTYYYVPTQTSTTSTSSWSSSSGRGPYSSTPDKNINMLGTSSKTTPTPIGATPQPGIDPDPMPDYSKNVNSNPSTGR